MSRGWKVVALCEVLTQLGDCFCGFISTPPQWVPIIVMVCWAANLGLLTYENVSTNLLATTDATNMTPKSAGGNNKAVHVTVPYAARLHPPPRCLDRQIFR